MQRLFRIVVFGLLLTASAVFSRPVPAQTEGPGVVREIAVEGNIRIEPDTIRSYLLIQEGDPYDPRRIDRSLKSLFATGLFADVTMRREGDVLVVSIVENPVINRIAFEGNKRLDDETLETEVSLRPRVIYTRTKVQNDVKRLSTLYRRNGRYAAVVEPKIIQLPQNRIDLVFEINEGDLAEIMNIRFVGNRMFSDSRLREVIRTKETRWYRFLTVDDTYDPDRLTLDREMLRRFYLSEGHADFRVISALAELTPDRKNFFITFTIEEGRRYLFGKVDVEANLRDLKMEDVMDVVEIEEGEWYDADLIESTLNAITDQVGTLGYPFVDVRPRIKRDRENLKIDISFEINEGPRVFVERIDIGGNVRTSENVIRREFRLVEGDAFNSAKLRRSKQRIQNLDFFSKVSVEQIPGSAPDKAAIKVDVAEKSTGSLSVGAGYSTTSGPLVDFGIRERNLLGHGQDLNLKATLATKKTELMLSFTEPYFLDREVTAGFDIFQSTRDLQDSSSIDTEVTGGALRTGYYITENFTQAWRYTLKESEITSISSSSPYIQSETGAVLQSSISHSLTYDLRDNILSPTEGYYLRLDTDLAGLGGDVQYLRNKLFARKYYRLTDQWVLGILGTTGYIVGIGKDVRFLDRFFVGGDSLRGFSTSGIGPRDVNTQDALGGEWMYTGTAELRFPLGLPNELGITAKVFSDIGSLGKLNFSSDEINDTGSLRASIGTGITWISPLGPIGLDFGIPVMKEDFDMTEIMRINFGTRF
ncbi:MAG: outer membrane protein assembly factor BamA [Rhodospirillales bacterium]